MRRVPIDDNFVILQSPEGNYVFVNLSDGVSPLKAY
jgi:hypothetical protein